MEVTSVLVPFNGQELTAIKSAKKDELCFFGKEVIKVTNHKNLSQALSDADCKIGEDYVVLIRKENPLIFNELVNLLVNPPSGLSNNSIESKKNPNKIKEITLVYESGFWKLSLSSKLPNGKELRNWLAKEVLPSIRKTGKYILSTIDTSTILESSKREVQIQKSKEVNTSFYELKGLPEMIKYNAENCKQVTGMYPNEVKNQYNSKESAKEILRKRKPELASTMCLNDSIIIQDNNVKLSDLKEFDKIAIALFCEAEKIGLKFSN
jgi:prophage antirepressor-like protein